ncbi:MAG: cytochrome c family protein [Desulfobulbaceae bacterium]|nr:cytochrome c family protein [Desulfobulbaceae bacterium]
MMNSRTFVFFIRTVLFPAAIFSAGIFHPALSPAAQNSDPPVYVGTRTCEPCHPEEYESFIRYAKKSESYRSIERLEKGLSPEDLEKCYSCHTTGYGRPGGFISIEQTPDLKNVGCEVCHGPGGEHAENGDPASIKGQLTQKDCEGCHTSERVRAFRYKPMIHGGGH